MVRGELKPNSKSNITLSIDNQLLEQIKEDSEALGISVNAKINAILSRHISFYKYAEMQKMMIIPPEIFSAMLERVEDEEMIMLLNKVALGTMPSVFAHNNIKPTLENLIKYCFENIFILGGMCTAFRHHAEDGHQVLVLEHQYSEKWSRVVGESLTFFLGEMLKKQVNYNALPNTVTLKIMN
ncbi:MAG TPA: hypothetical protein VLT10_00425 [Verrucomicrobiae bacterium]|nr:hypothetical protein [Verrucomicrobiae bacterium]